MLITTIFPIKFGRKSQIFGKKWKNLEIHGVPCPHQAKSRPHKITPRLTLPTIESLQPIAKNTIFAALEK